MALAAPVIELDDSLSTEPLAAITVSLPDALAASSPEAAYQQWLHGRRLANPLPDRVVTEPASGAQWLAFQLFYPDEASGREWVISARDVMHLTRITLYEPRAGGYEEHRDSLHAVGEPALGTSLSSFVFNADFDRSKPFLLKVEGQLPIKAALVVQSSQRAQWEAAVRIALPTLFIGAVIGLAFYNLILYFFVRDNAYLYYVAYAFTMCVWLVQISGLMLFINRDFGLWFYGIYPANLGAGIANFFGSLFTLVFLRLLQQHRWQGVAVLATSLANVLLGVVASFVDDQALFRSLHHAQFMLAGINAVVIVVPTILLAIRGFRFALPFVFAWGSLGSGIILFATGHQPVVFGVPFAPNFNILTSMALEMILMSYALGMRFQVAHQEINKLSELSITDGLTNLHNQRHYHDVVNQLLKSDIPTPAPWVAVLIDIDHFKSFNDNYGHAVGDKVLKILSEILRKNIRKQDFAFRAGGEEFALLLNTDTLVDAEKIAERIRENFCAAVVEHSGERLRCTLSAGITQLLPSDSTESFIGRADSALYSAKNSGRNRIAVH
ncbi:diguanylate cyclase [Halioxenophilus sp. WMMB6]|uniref:sensor domain-containing diguanylate cyclase n=1 Tax=Halioxenophilus sp. WMMB6 TaxID=3073815 RepID=UPI00295E3E16|nr:diguanylate cyclase [Halioxenophilus sp. WMMB6]